MLPVILVAPLVKFLGNILSHADPAVRERAFKLYLDKRAVKTKDAAKYLVDNVRNLHEVLNKLVRKPSFKKLLLSLGKDEAKKFYTTKGKVRGFAEKLFRLL